MIARTPYRSSILVAVGITGLCTPLMNAGLADSGSSSAVWIVDLITHWQWLWLPIFIIGTLTLAINTRLALLLLPLVILPWITAAPESQQAGSESVNGKLFTLTAWNAGGIAELDVSTEHDTDSLDLLVITELTPLMTRRLEQLHTLPYRAMHPSSGPFGLGILSRAPILSASLQRDDNGVPLLDVRIRWGEEQIRVVAIHPMPPIRPIDHVIRDKTFADLAASFDVETPLIMAGDLNATPWSTAFQHFTTAGIKRASGLTPTWPAVFRGAFGIPIDHILVNGHWRTVQSGTLVMEGSDHLAVTSVLERTSHTAN